MFLKQEVNKEQKDRKNRLTRASLKLSQILKNYLSYFINKKEEHLNYENLFLKEFVLAMFITCVLSYEVS